MRININNSLGTFIDRQYFWFFDDLVLLPTTSRIILLCKWRHQIKITAGIFTMRKILYSLKNKIIILDDFFRKYDKLLTRNIEY